ncbi:MAG: peptidoglycan-binding protein [Deltaproteobacteria bacterium]|nr:peptidoglycan-binding protein [Deltaproteobacteria bacterium]
MGEMKKVKSITKSLLVLAGMGLLLLPLASQSLAADQAAPSSDKAVPMSQLMAPSKDDIKAQAMAAKRAGKPCPICKMVQQALIDRGYNLEVNGYLNDVTKAAISDFQQKNNLKVTGHGDEPTRKALGLDI